MSDGMIEVKVKQPPRIPKPFSKAALRKKIASAKREHKAFMKAARGRIRALNAGARMSRRRSAYTKQQIRSLQKLAKTRRILHANKQRAYKQQIKEARAATALAKSATRQAKLRIRAMKRAQASKTVPTRTRQMKQRWSGAKKAATAAWVWRLLKQAFKSHSAGDGRNHGFAKSGRGGRTGRAGYW